MNNVKYLRKKAGLSQKELADRLNVDQTAVSRWELGKSFPDAETLKLLADFFEVSIDQLLGRMDLDGPAFPNRIEEIISKLKPVTLQRLPMLGNIAAGKPLFAKEEHEFMVDTNVKADFCLTVVGDSMIGAGILDGDVIFVRQQPDVRNGQIAAVLIGDDATLKRVYKRQDQIILQAENPDYEPIIVNGSDGQDVQILGLAVGFSRMFKW